jgi:hypothetical protein
MSEVKKTTKKLKREGAPKLAEPGSGWKAFWEDHERGEAKDKARELESEAQQYKHGQDNFENLHPGWVEPGKLTTLNEDYELINQASAWNSGAMIPSPSGKDVVRKVRAKYQDLRERKQAANAKLKELGIYEPAYKRKARASDDQ